jgi:Mg2+/Co2+ transporter CorC
MTKLLFNMHGVPEDEIQDVRELCETHEFAVYETEIGRWGIGLAAIWLSDDSQLDAAKEKLNEYQQARYENAQEDRAKIQGLSVAEGLYVKLKQDPNQFVLTLIGLTAILALTLYPFIDIF